MQMIPKNVVRLKKKRTHYPLYTVILAVKKVYSMFFKRLQYVNLLINNYIYLKTN